MVLLPEIRKHKHQAPASFKLRTKSDTKRLNVVGLGLVGVGHLSVNTLAAPAPLYVICTDRLIDRDPHPPFQILRFDMVVLV